MAKQSLDEWAAQVKTGEGTLEYWKERSSLIEDESKVERKAREKAERERDEALLLAEDNQRKHLQAHRWSRENEERAQKAEKERDALNERNLGLSVDCASMRHEKGEALSRVLDLQARLAEAELERDAYREGLYREEFDMLLKEYAQEADESLAPDAIGLKRTLNKIVKELADADLLERAEKAEKERDDAQLLADGFEEGSAEWEDEAKQHKAKLQAATARDVASRGALRRAWNTLRNSAEASLEGKHLLAAHLAAVANEVHEALSDPCPAAERLLACERFARRALGLLSNGRDNETRVSVMWFAELLKLLASDDARLVQTKGW